MKLDLWLIDGAGLQGGPIAGFRRMGGTRMATQPADSIVDANYQAFRRSTVDLAGSYVLPSAGDATPTFTIVQLALRLVDHLRRG